MIIKEWCTKETAKQLGYLSDNNTHDLHLHHKEFNNWLINNFTYKDMSVFDIGCGNGQVIKYLQSFNKYVGIDINEYSLKVAQKTKKENVLFFLQDIELEIGNNIYAQMDQCNICYIDSVITMLENPQRILTKVIIPNFKYIYLNRTKMYNNTTKTQFKWAGMCNESTLWKFGHDFFTKVCENSNSNYTIVGTTVIINTK